MDDVHLDDEDELSTRAKSMDEPGAGRCTRARVRGSARIVEAEGWQLTNPVDDDWGFIRKGRAADLS
jgi:hypothetical protein